MTDWTLPICWILFGCHVKLHSWKFESGLTDIRAVVFFTFWFSHGLTALAFFRNLPLDDACFHPSTSLFHMQTELCLCSLKGQGKRFLMHKSILTDHSLLVARANGNCYSRSQVTTHKAKRNKSRRPTQCQRGPAKSNPPHHTHHVVDADASPTETSQSADGVPRRP